MDEFVDFVLVIVGIWELGGCICLEIDVIEMGKSIIEIFCGEVVSWEFSVEL